MTPRLLSRLRRTYRCPACGAWRIRPIPADPNPRPHSCVTRAAAGVPGRVKARFQPDRDPLRPDPAAGRSRNGGVLIEDGIVDELAIARAVAGVGTPVALTRREREHVVIKLAARGVNDHDIAARCGVAFETIRRDRGRLGVAPGEPPPLARRRRQGVDA